MASGFWYTSDCVYFNKVSLAKSENLSAYSKMLKRKAAFSSVDMKQFAEFLKYICGYSN